MTVLAFSLLCENPQKLTGLNSMVREFVSRSLEQDPQLRWILFLGPEHSFAFSHERLSIVRDYPANDRMKERLWADHFLVSPHAKRLGAKLLFTVGFAPLREAIPTVMHLLTLHHLDRSNRMDPWRALYRRWAVARGLRRARLVITNSKFAAGQILASAPFVGGKLLQSYEGLDHENYHPPEAGATRPDFGGAFSLPEHYILWLSNLYPYKQADLLVRAYAGLPPELRERFPLVFVGGDWNNQKALILERAGELGIADRIRFPGWVEDRWIVPLIQYARIYVLPSREETFGRSVAEAMACGVPCVVNDIPIMREVTAEAAWIVDFGDIPAAAAALRAALTEEEDRREIIRRGLVRARDFDFDLLTRERMEAVHKILK